MIGRSDRGRGEILVPGRPSRSSTKPPNTDRAAETELLRARSLTPAPDHASPAAALAASASAANADALEARPAAVGKSLELKTLARAVMPACARTRSRSAVTRRASPSFAACPRA